MFIINESNPIEVLKEVSDTVFSHYCYTKRIAINAPKTIISTNEILAITFSWEIFSLETESYEPDPAEEPIIYQVNDLASDTLDNLVNGSDTLLFSSAEPGTYIIRSNNHAVGNSFLEVVVSA